MFSVGLGNLSLPAVINRGQFIRRVPNLIYLIGFQGVLVLALFFICFGIASRRYEKTNWFGILMLGGLSVGLLVTIFTYQSLSVALITAAPFLLAVERFTHSKHIWLALIGWVMTAAQGMVYTMLLLSKRLMRAALLNLGSLNQNFPYQLYWSVSLISLIFCFIGPHIEISHDWKTLRRDQQANTIEERTRP